MEKCCVFPFLIVLWISSGQIVQYLRLIYFYGFGLAPVSLRRQRGGDRKQSKGESEKVLPRTAY